MEKSGLQDARLCGRCGATRAGTRGQANCWISARWHSAPGWQWLGRTARGFCKGLQTFVLSPAWSRATAGVPTRVRANPGGSLSCSVSDPLLLFCSRRLFPRAAPEPLAWIAPRPPTHVQNVLSSREKSCTWTYACWRLRRWLLSSSCPAPHPCREG
jgi:hypothetical protein